MTFIWGEMLWLLLLVPVLSSLGSDGNATLTLSAFAPGTPDDPSTARRLSLSRALAARSLLIAEGLPSPRITVRSLGASEPGFSAGPPDRVDLVVSSPPTSQAKPAP